MKPETKFRVNKVDKFLMKLKNTHSESIQQQGISGTADKHLCIWGRFVALECKKSHKKADKPGPLQQNKLDEISRTGGVAIVASPDNWEEVKHVLSKMDESKETAWKQKSLLNTWT